MYEDFTVLPTHKPYKKLPEISDSKNMLIAYTYNPAFWELCKEKYLPKEVFIKNLSQNYIFSILFAIFAKELQKQMLKWY